MQKCLGEFPSGVVVDNGLMDDVLWSVSVTWSSAIAVQYKSKPWRIPIPYAMIQGADVALVVKWMKGHPISPILVALIQPW